MGAYQQELKRAMDYLAEQSDTVFLGQAVAGDGNDHNTGRCTRGQIS